MVKVVQILPFILVVAGGYAPERSAVIQSAAPFWAGMALPLSELKTRGRCDTGERP